MSEERPPARVFVHGSDYDDYQNNLLGIVNDLDNVRIVEELNGCYTLSFDALFVDNWQYLVPKNLLTINTNQLENYETFRIQKVTRTRNTTTGISVYCEHISYDLLEFENATKRFEGTLEYMVEALLVGTGFTRGLIPTTESKIYKPETKNVKQRLIDVCKLFGVDMEFSEKVINFHYEFGAEEEFTILLGENLVSVTVTDEAENGEITSTYDINLLDLSGLDEFSHFKTLKLGNIAVLSDPPLGLFERVRVIKYDVDPFNIVDASVQLGGFVTDTSTQTRAVSNDIASVKTDIADLKDSVVGDQGLTLEFASGLVKFDTPAIFNFTAAYDDILSITTGVSGTYEAIVFTEKISTGGKYTGVKVSITGGGSSGIIASIQAVCKVVL